MTDRERVAEAMAAADALSDSAWAVSTRAEKDAYLRMADAAIAALDAARAEQQPSDADILGSLVVPGEVDGT